MLYHVTPRHFSLAHCFCSALYTVIFPKWSCTTAITASEIAPVWSHAISSSISEIVSRNFHKIPSRLSEIVPAQLHSIFPECFNGSLYITLPRSQYLELYCHGFIQSAASHSIVPARRGTSGCWTHATSCYFGMAMYNLLVRIALFQHQAVQSSTCRTSRNFSPTLLHIH